MKLIIPMAGRGKRLRPVSSVTPKPLVSVRGRSMVERIVAGFADVLPRPVTDCVFILGPSFEREARPILERICGRHRARPHYVVQHEALGTAHAVAMANEYLQGEGIVVYADTVFDMGGPVDLDGCDVLVWVKHVDDPRRFGVAVREGERVVAFVEKPQEPVSTEALIGIYYVRELAALKGGIEHVFEHNICGKGGEYYLTDAFDVMLKAGALFKTTSVRYWLDCGTVAAFMDTVHHLLLEENQEPPTEAVIDSVIIPPVYVGPHARVEHSVIGPYTCIEQGARISRAVVQRSIVFEGASVQEAVLTGACVGAHATVAPASRTLSVGDHSVVH